MPAAETALPILKNPENVKVLSLGRGFG